MIMYSYQFTFMSLMVYHATRYLNAHLMSFLMKCWKPGQNQTCWSHLLSRFLWAGISQKSLEYLQDCTIPYQLSDPLNNEQDRSNQVQLLSLSLKGEVHLKKKGLLHPRLHALFQLCKKNLDPTVNTVQGRTATPSPRGL